MLTFLMARIWESGPVPKKLKPLPGAPLVEVDKNELGDKRLNPEEAVAREREELLAIRFKKHAISGQESLIDIDRSTGSRIPCGEFLVRLHKLNPAILVKDGIPGNVALYVRKSEIEIECDGYDLTLPMWRNEHKYVSGIPISSLPEWGHLTTDTDGIAEKEVRGWRSVLIALIKARAFTYAAAVEEFGDPVFDQRSSLWYDQLSNFIGATNVRERQSRPTTH
jgi:hypothetical protein